MVRVCILLLVVAIALGANPAAAETILLKDGSRLSGRIVGADAESFQFQTPDGILTIRRERIESMDYTGANPDSITTAAVSISAPPVEAVPAVFVAPLPTTSFPRDRAGLRAREASGVSPYFAGGFRSPNSNVDIGFSGEVGVLNQVSPSVFLGGSVGVTHFNNKVGWWISKGNVTLVPAMVRLVLRQRAGLSFGAGLGYAFATHSLASEVEAAVASLGLGLNEKVRGALNAEASLGYTAVSGAKLSGGVLVGYEFLKPKNEITVSALSSGASLTLTGDLDFSTPFVRAFVSF